MRYFLFCLVFLRLYSLEVSDLTLEEKIGQLLIVKFYGNERNQESDRLIQQAHVGGFIYYTWANELTSAAQVKKLSGGLQASSKIPLFLSVDQEGGRVNRLNQGFTAFPDNATIAETKNQALAEEVAFDIGQELRAVGINMNFSPVVDVNINPDNPVIGRRSFSPDPKIVAAFGAKALEGYRKANVIAVLKHFPGHGDVTVDSHHGIPIVAKKIEDLRSVEWYPYFQLVKDAPAIMTAHIIEKAIDPSQIATFSPAVINKLLRDEIGFKGVIITDSLAMEAVYLSSSSLQEAALKALQAGHDVLCLGGKLLVGQHEGYEVTADDMIAMHRYLVNAVRQGKISEARINQSVQRVLNLKNNYLLFSKTPEVKFNLAEHQALADKILKLTSKNNSG